MFSVPQLIRLSIVNNKSALFSPLNVRHMEMMNRMMISPKCTYQAGTDGVAVDTHFAHYSQFFFGGAGLVMLETIAVEPRGRISAGDLGLWCTETEINLTCR
jgi:NADPH2 dehydrogenase